MQFCSLFLFLLVQPLGNFALLTVFDAILAHWKFEQNLESTTVYFGGSVNGTATYASFLHNNQTFAGYQFSSDRVLTLPSEYGSSYLPIKTSWTVAGIFTGSYPDGPLIHFGGLDSQDTAPPISLWVHQAGSDTLTLRIEGASVSANCYAREFFFAAVTYNSASGLFNVFCIGSDLMSDHRQLSSDVINRTNVMTTYLTVGHGIYPNGTKIGYTNPGFVFCLTFFQVDLTLDELNQTALEYCKGSSMFSVTIPDTSTSTPMTTTVQTTAGISPVGTPSTSAAATTTPVLSVSPINPPATSTQAPSLSTASSTIALPTSQPTTPTDPPATSTQAPSLSTASSTIASPTSQPTTPTGQLSELELLSILEQISKDQKGLSDKNSVKEILSKLYPNLPMETYLPKLTSDRLLEMCDHFSSNRLAPPNNGQPTEITTLFFIEKLGSFDTFEQSATVSAEFFMHWNVTTCGKFQLLSGFNGNLGPSERMFGASEQNVWLPTYAFDTSSKNVDISSNDFGDDLVATTKPNAGLPNPNQTIDFYHLRKGFFTTKCKSEIQLFPFDMAVCNFTFSLERPISHVVFSSSVFLCPDKVFTEWRYLECKTELPFIHQHNGYMTNCVSFVAVMARNYTYYLMNLVLPVWVLAVLQMASFLMPPHRADRPILSIVILLAITVSHSDLASGMPRESGRVLLSDFFLSFFWLSAFITFFHMIACCNVKSPKTNAKSSFQGRKIDFIFFCIALAAFVILHIFFYYQIKNRL